MLTKGDRQAVGLLYQSSIKGVLPELNYIHIPSRNSLMFSCQYSCILSVFLWSAAKTEPRQRALVWLIFAVWNTVIQSSIIMPEK